MSTLVKDALATMTAAIVPVADHAQPPLGYGADISCASDLDPHVAELDGHDPLVLAQALVRRFDCPRGALPDDPNYGLDLRAYCNEGTTAAEIRALAGQLRLEAQKDDRVDDVVVTVRPRPDGSDLQIEFLVQPVALTGLIPSPFSFTLAASSAALLIEALRGAPERSGR